MKFEKLKEKAYRSSYTLFQALEELEECGYESSIFAVIDKAGDDRSKKILKGGDHFVCVGN